MGFFETKKAKKAAQLKKNRFQQELFNLVRLRRVDEERVEGLAESLKPRKAEKKENEIWSEKTTAIRDRLTGHKRQSKERWNRFAGTGGEGGRGL